MVLTGCEGCVRSWDKRLDGLDGPSRKRREGDFSEASCPGDGNLFVERLIHWNHEKHRAKSDCVVREMSKRILLTRIEAS